MRLSGQERLLRRNCATINSQLALECTLGAAVNKSVQTATRSRYSQENENRLQILNIKYCKKYLNTSCYQPGPGFMVPRVATPLQYLLLITIKLILLRAEAIVLHQRLYCKSIHNQIYYLPYLKAFAKEVITYVNPSQIQIQPNGTNSNKISKNNNKTQSINFLYKYMKNRTYHYPDRYSVKLQNSCFRSNKNSIKFNHISDKTVKILLKALHKVE